jgi:hypothetical protein
MSVYPPSSKGIFMSSWPHTHHRRSRRIALLIVALALPFAIAGSSSLLVTTAQAKEVIVLDQVIITGSYGPGGGSSLSYSDPFGGGANTSYGNTREVGEGGGGGGAQPAEPREVVVAACASARAIFVAFFGKAEVPATFDQGATKLAQDMMSEVLKASRALDWVPRPPTGPASLGWLASQAVQTAVRVAGAQHIYATAMAAVKYNYASAFRLLKAGEYASNNHAPCPA